MKRSSFVCLGAQGSKDSLVYQEIPGKEGGEELFIFFAAGAPGQEALLRPLFREAVSASRLGAPLHFFSNFIDRFRYVSGEGGPVEDAFDGALLLMQIRRGDEAFVLRNRSALLLHWDGERGMEAPIEALPSFRELPLGEAVEQRDLFRRKPEDYFALCQFTMAAGSHTLVLVPSREFADRYAGPLRDSIFFPSFEMPQEAGLELPVDRSFPALHWQAGPKVETAAPDAASLPRLRRPPAPLVAAAATAVVAIAAFIAFRGGREGAAGGGESTPRLSAVDASRDTAREERVGERPRNAPAGDRGVLFGEAWKRTFRAPVTSSPRCCDGTVYFGCRDGYLYAYRPDGELRWKYRASGGVGASPLCLPGRVIGADYGGHLFCLDRDSGTPVWKSATGAKIVSTPVAGDDLVYAATTDGRMVAVRLSDGTKVWEKKVGRSIRATSAAGRTYIVAATTDGALVKLDSAGRILWKAAPGGEILSSPLCLEDRDLVVVGAADRSVQAYSLSKGERVWTLKTDAAANGSPVSGGGAIYIGTSGGSVYAVDQAGKQLWRASVGGAVLSKPLVAGRTLFVTTYGSSLVALDAETGTVIERFRAGSPIYSSPEQDGTLIYFGSNGGIFYALRLSPAA